MAGESARLIGLIGYTPEKDADSTVRFDSSESVSKLSAVADPLR